jgi:tetratricopeptide (TPR) repeat protein
MIKSIKIETASGRTVLIIAGFLCLAAIFFFAKWCFVNAIAAKAPTKEVAELSVDLAPNDPQTHYALAVLNEKTFLSENLPKSLREFEQAVALSPNDFRLWLEYGKARERSGDDVGAELSLRKALEFAPNYAQVQWTLGNVLLRHGKIREAFVEIRRAAESDKNFRIPAIAAAWQIFNGSLADVKQNIGDSANLNSALMMFLAKQKRFAEAVEIWNALPAEEKKTTIKTEGEALFGELIAAKQYRTALEIQTSIDDKSNAENFAFGTVFNGGFEAEVKREKATVFDWQIADGRQPQIGFDDNQKVGGTRSLVIIFNSTDGRDFRQVSQIIAVEAARKYGFSSFYKSDLKTSATLRWEIIDDSNGKILATTNPISANADWTNLKTEFITAAGTEAVIIRLVRESCKSIICPIAGKVWFDDFSIN